MDNNSYIYLDASDAHNRHQCADRGIMSKEIPRFTCRTGKAILTP